MPKFITFYMQSASFSVIRLCTKPKFPARCLRLITSHSLSASTCHGRRLEQCSTNCCCPRFMPEASRGFSSSCIFRADESDAQKGRAEMGKDDAAATSQASDKPLSQRQKLTRTFAAYGTTGVIFHTCISLASLGTCYMIVSSGIDMVSLMEKLGIASKAGMQSTLASGASTFVIAYACHKVFMPVRIFLTVTCTPIIVNRLKRIGILKDKANMKVPGS